MTNDQLRIGLIGTGRIGRVHAVNIAALPETTLSWVIDPFVAGAEAIAEPSGARATGDPGEAFASGELDAVVIASPTSTHADLIKQAIEAGIPVLCEKPIDLDIARVDELAPLVESSGVPFAVGFNRRFDRDFSAARDRLIAGEIGPLEQLSIISRDPAPPTVENLRTTGGIFRDQTIHDFDMARYFAPDIVEVFATGSAVRRRSPGDERLRHGHGDDEDIDRSADLDHELPAQRHRLRPEDRGLRRTGHARGRQCGHQPGQLFERDRGEDDLALSALLPRTLRRGLCRRAA